MLSCEKELGSFFLSFFLSFLLSKRLGQVQISVVDSLEGSIRLKEGSSPSLSK